MINDLKNFIEKNLTEHLKSSLPRHPFSDVYLYGVLPAGKLFRPLLVYSLFKDFSSKPNDFEKDHAYFSSAIEIHHAYTLIHDDLPPMDNDEYRRGRLTVHKKFNEWQALLAGDGLLNISYGLLSQINPQKLPTILRFTSWATGPKGLIQGQYLDLSEEMKISFSSLISTHEYKTARLITLSILGSYELISHKKNPSSYRTRMDLFKLGNALGISFQLLDDLTELTQKELTPHEKAINPWFYFKSESLQRLEKDLQTIEKISLHYEMHTFRELMKEYFSKIYHTLHEALPTIARHQNDDPSALQPMIRLLKKLTVQFK